MGEYDITLTADAGKGFVHLFLKHIFSERAGFHTWRVLLHLLLT